MNFFFLLVFNIDGNGVIYTINNKAVWETDTKDRGERMTFRHVSSKLSISRINFFHFFFYKQDGVLEVKSELNSAIWSSKQGSGAQPPFKLALENTGQLTIYGVLGQFVWRSENQQVRSAAIRCVRQKKRFLLDYIVFCLIITNVRFFYNISFLKKKKKSNKNTTMFNSR